MSELIVPISVFVVFAFIVSEIIDLIKTVITHRTIGRMMDKGEPVPPSMVRQSSRRIISQQTGIILIFVSIGLFVAALLLAQSGSEGLVAVAICTLFAGLGFLVASRLFKGEQDYSSSRTDNAER
jgi:hypothetical protein